MKDKLTEILNKSVEITSSPPEVPCWCKPMETGILEMSLRCLREGGVWTLESTQCPSDCSGDCAVWGRCLKGGREAWGWGSPNADNGKCRNVNNEI